MVDKEADCISKDLAQITQILKYHSLFVTRQMMMFYLLK